MASNPPVEEEGSIESFAPTPLLELFPAAELPWAVIGIPISQVPKISLEGEGGVGEAFLPFLSTSYLTFPQNEKLLPYYPLNIDVIKDNIRKLAYSARKKLAEIRNRVMHSDPEAILKNAEDMNYSGYRNVRNLSPIKAIENIISLLRDISGNSKITCEAPPSGETGTSNNLESRETSSEAFQLETTQILCRIKHAMEDVQTGHYKRLEIVAMESRLDRNPNFLSDRIENIFRKFIFKRFKRE